MIVFVNGDPQEVAADATLGEVLRARGDAEPRRGVAVALNGSVVPRARLAETTVQEGATVEIVTAVQGG